MQPLLVFALDSSNEAKTVVTIRNVGRGVGLDVVVRIWLRGLSVLKPIDIFDTGLREADLLEYFDLAPDPKETRSFEIAMVIDTRSVTLAIEAKDQMGSDHLLQAVFIQENGTAEVWSERRFLDRHYRGRQERPLSVRAYDATKKFMAALRAIDTASKDD